MNTNEQTVMTNLEEMLYAAKAVQKLNQDRELIAEYRAIAKEEGKVWGDLSEEEITVMIVANETKKEMVRQAALEDFKCPEPTPIVLEVNLDDDFNVDMRNLCVNCGIDMGVDNPRQLCDKTHCPYDKDEFVECQLKFHDIYTCDCCGKKLQRGDDGNLAPCPCGTNIMPFDLFAFSGPPPELRKVPEVPALKVQVQEVQSLREQAIAHCPKALLKVQVPALKVQVPALKVQVPALKVQVPAPKLMFGNVEQAFEHISRLTNCFANMEPETTTEVFNRLHNRQMTAFGYMPAPRDSAVCKRIIGKNGCYFKMTTLNANVDFIWHDRKENHFLFWGQEGSVRQAMQIIQERSDKFSQ